MTLCKNKRKLMDYLGNDYIVKNIDLEPCVYRDFGSYDVEISGGYYTRPFRIYVWQTEPYMRIMEQYDMPSNDYRAVSNLLNDIALRYKCREAV